MDEKELREMSLHRRVKMGDSGYILRVVGGWIYERIYSCQDATIIHPVFVPEPPKDIKYINTPSGWVRSSDELLGSPD